MGLNSWDVNACRTISMSSFYFFFYFMLGCSTNNGNYDALAKNDTSAVTRTPTVRIIKVSRKVFEQKTITNGKIVALRQAPILSKVSGIVTKLTIANGAYVTAGQLVACLENKDQKLAIDEANLLLDQSKVELLDLLIAQGGKNGDTNTVSKDVYSYIKLKSGYDRAIIGLQKARRELEKTFLYTPLSGVVANLKLSEHAPISEGVPLCVIFNRTTLAVRCYILESELSTVTLGQLALVQPVSLSNSSYDAKVTSINPSVNEQGLIEIVVEIKKVDPNLFPGMNARVIIKKPVNRQLVVPKRAVVERNAKKVIFTYKGGLAYWNYVSVGPENDEDIVVTEGLDESDTVIVSGGLNLAHESKVEIGN